MRFATRVVRTSVWRVGELNRLGKHDSTSGVTLLLSDLENSDEMVAQVSAALSDLSPRVSELIRDGTVVKGLGRDDYPSTATPIAPRKSEYRSLVAKR